MFTYPYSIYIVLLLLIHTSIAPLPREKKEVKTYNKNYCSKICSDEDTDEKDGFEEDLEDIHVNISTVTGLQSMINPYKSLMVRETVEKPFSSACIKCATCIAVAQEINNTLVSLQDRSHGKLLEEEEVVDNLTDLCCSGFSDFGIREYEGKRFVSKNLPHTKHVSSSMDGIWTEKLQEFCATFLEEYGPNELYQQWYGNRNDLSYLVNELCRKSGLYRSCANVDNLNETIALHNCKIRSTTMLFCMSCLKS